MNCHPKQLLAYVIHNTRIMSIFRLNCPRVFVLFFTVTQSTGKCDILFADVYPWVNVTVVRCIYIDTIHCMSLRKFIPTDPIYFANDTIRFVLRPLKRNRVVYISCKWVYEFFQKHTHDHTYLCTMYVACKDVY